MADNSEHQSDYDNILALARAGSTQFALSEYMRLGLHEVRNDEDFMALHGRLYKDLYLSHTGDTATQAAKMSAEKYQAAYRDTAGFYSGINAATMSFLAGCDETQITLRARQIVDVLPSVDEFDAETRYFIEATRAEAYLLLGNKHEASRSLTLAWEHDPLNYLAHASTLKQFRLIAAHRGDNVDWLEAFNPPCAVHYAGHIFFDFSSGPSGARASIEDMSELKTQISEMIQANDIGFGFGSIAAGSDILIAETLIEEGAELHISLPVNESVFIRESVAPFGETWLKKYKVCRAAAKSFKIMTDYSDWPNMQLDQMASLSCMGSAIRQGQLLSVKSLQLLILDQTAKESATFRDASHWNKDGRDGHIIPFSKKHKTETRSRNDDPFSYAVMLCRDDQKTPMEYDDVCEALTCAIQNRGHEPELKQALTLEIIMSRSKASQLSQILCQHAKPGSIYVSQLAADYLALKHSQSYSVDFMGKFGANERMYSVNTKM